MGDSLSLVCKTEFSVMPKRTYEGFMKTFTRAPLFVLYQNAATSKAEETPEVLCCSSDPAFAGCVSLFDLNMISSV